MPKTNPNISDRPPLKEFAYVASIVLGGGIVVYIVLGFLAGWAAAKLPWSVEQRWGNLVVQALGPVTADDHSLEEAELQALLDSLVAHLPSESPPFILHLVEEDLANAGTLPGGHILVFRGLLNEVESENELSMILGHELGHAVNRDPIRAMGRQLVLAMAASMLFGSDSIAANLIGGSLDLIELSFSRDQEARADDLGLDVLQSTYGHVGGFTDFFERHEAEDMPSIQWLLTHPLSGARIERLRARAAERGYSIGDTIAPGAWADPSE